MCRTKLAMLRGLVSTGSHEADLCERIMASIAGMSAALIWISAEIGDGLSWSKLMMLSSVATLFVAGSGLTLTQRLCGAAKTGRFAGRRRKPDHVIALPGNVTVAFNAMRGSDADITRTRRAVQNELATLRRKVEDLISGFQSGIDSTLARTVIATDATMIAVKLTQKNNKNLAAFSEAEAAAGTMLLHLEAMQAGHRRIREATILAAEGLSDQKTVAEAVKQEAAASSLLLQDLSDVVGSSAKTIATTVSCVFEMEGDCRKLLAAQEAISVENAALAEQLMGLHGAAGFILSRIEEVAKIVDRAEAMESRRENSAATVFDEFIRKRASATIIARMLKDASDRRPQNSAASESEHMIE